MAAPQVIDLSVLSFLFAAGGTVAAIATNYAITQTKVNALQAEIADLKQTTVTKEVLQLHLTNIETKFTQVMTAVNDVKELLRGRVPHD